MKCKLETFERFTHLTVDDLCKWLKEHEKAIREPHLTIKIGREFMFDYDGYSEPNGLFFVEIGTNIEINSNLCKNELCEEAEKDRKTLEYYLNKTI